MAIVDLGDRGTVPVFQFARETTEFLLIVYRVERPENMVESSGLANKKETSILSDGAFGSS